VADIPDVAIEASSKTRLSRQVLELAWPVMISMGMVTAFTLTDAFWVGKLGPDALAAVAPAQFASWILWSLGSVLEVGIPSLVARAVGAGERARAIRAAAAGIQLAVLIAIPVALFALPFSNVIFRFVGTPPTVTEMGVTYLSVLLWGSIFLFVILSLESTLRAAGDTKTPMMITIVSLGINFILDPLLILGVGPFPQWGVMGAAIATVISEAIGLGAYVVVFARGRARVSPARRDLQRIEPAIWRKILRIGIPGAFNAFLFVVVYLVLSNVVARYGNPALAVLGVGNRLESVNYLIATGFSVSASTLVGQYLGAKRPDLAERAAWLSTLYSVIFTGVVGAVYFIFPGPIFGLFTRDPATLAEGIRFLTIIALCQVWMGVEIPIFGAFTGAGSTGSPVAISATISLLRIPLAYLFALTLATGTLGVWWVMTLTCVLRGALLAAWFRRGRWKAAKIW